MGIEFAEFDAKLYALLTAAKGRPLMLRQTAYAVLCSTSCRPNEGWYAARIYPRMWTPDPSRGGPWSVEFVETVAAMGLLGIDVDPASGRVHADLTKAGVARLKQLAQPAAASAAPIEPDKAP